MSQNNPNETDYENIKRFYTAFKKLKDSQATEERLWAGLCHSNYFWDYLKYRWDCKDETQVLARYFFSSEDGRRPIFYNGLARLWGDGRMTYDENAKDPFELTKYICENLTTKGYLTMTFAFSHNQRICKTYLRTMMDFEKRNKLTVEEYEKSRRYVNLLGGKVLLDSLSDEELTKKINDYLDKLVKNRNKVNIKKSETIEESDEPYKKECPSCNKKVVGKEELEKYFGWRNSAGKTIPQSYCRKCRI